jgi:hypothetical protein
MSERRCTQNRGYNGYAGYSQYPCGFQRNRDRNRVLFERLHGRIVTASVTAVTLQTQRRLRIGVTRKASVHAGSERFNHPVTAVTQENT